MAQQRSCLRVEGGDDLHAILQSDWCGRAATAESASCWMRTTRFGIRGAP